MIEFIVLGLVPGTQFQLTLWWVLVLAFVASLAILYRVEKPRFSGWVNKLRVNESDQAKA